MTLDINTLYQRYLNGESICGVLAPELGISRCVIYKAFKDAGLTIKNNREKSLKYSCNEHYFDIIDTQDKAYWLGFISADGYITSDMKYFGMSLSSKDIEVLQNLKEDLEATYPIKHYVVKQGYTVGVEYDRLIMSNPTLVNGLYIHGVVPHKTNILQPPSGLPEELQRHYLRGYFDGDGSVSVSKGQTLSWDILSTFPMLDYFSEMLYNNHIIDRYYPYEKRKPEHQVARIRFSKHKSLINVFHFMYDDAHRKLERKYNKFIEYFTEHNSEY